MLIENNIVLFVPPDSKIRDEIRLTVESYLLNKKSEPPVTFQDLTDISEALLKKYFWDQSYLAFTMICCGNSIWRSVFSRVPFHRRILLLPQCLKNSHSCKGIQDEMGLLCLKCGNCSISEIIEEAEALGYVTIVAEGTSIASRLIESGKIDAIIGVGCMSVLQKLVRTVNKYSIPSIGIPLISCGCINTTMDIAWIKEEMNQIDNKSGFELLNLNTLIEKTSNLFSEKHIDTLLKLSNSQTDRIVKDLMLVGGKRIRPLLTVLAYEAFSPQPDVNILAHLAMSIECFHKASLIHDDIEDNDSFRYGNETLHAKYGVPIAINIGDLLIGEGYRLLSESNLPSDLKLNCLSIIAQGHKTLSLGQSDDLLTRRNRTILTVDETLQIYKNKTSAAFKVSLFVGAVAGSAGENELSILDRVSHLFGLAYQIKDDLEDYCYENDTALENPSVFISLLYENANNAEKLLICNSNTQENAKTIHLLIEKYQIKTQITCILKDNIKQIYEALLSLGNFRLKLSLHEIVGKTFNDYI